MNSKIRTILMLGLFILFIFSIDMVFGNPIRETFSGRLVSDAPNINTNDELKKIQSVYSGQGFLGEINKSDDQPLFFGFSN